MNESSEKMNNPSNSYTKQGNQLGNQFSFAAILFHQAIAEKAGLNVTDYKCIRTILNHEHLTPSKLAQLSGLSTAL